jgi:dTDP-4-amino-4,6-dideoxygalactose transaminase
MGSASRTAAAVLKQIPLLNLEAQHRPIRDEILAAVARVIDSHQFILGEEVRKLEEEIASYCGTAYAIGCASGSDALFLALLALGIGPGDEVLTTPYSFFATAGEISRIGAVPVFADIEEHTFQLDPNRIADQLASHPRIRAILPVHLFGGCADMDAICELAEARGIPVIEDAAQAIGAEYKGRRAGGIGRVGCFSFYPTKNLGGLGDGGILTTGDPQ